jgi:hypothetical protein
VTTGAPDSRSAATSGSQPGPTGRAEGGQGRGPQLQLLGGECEELGVLRVRSRPAALDEPDAEVVEVARHVQLVLHGEVESLLLGTVAHRGVVDVEGVAGHARQSTQRPA